MQLKQRKSKRRIVRSLRKLTFVHSCATNNTVINTAKLGISQNKAKIEALGSDQSFTAAEGAFSATQTSDQLVGARSGC